MVEVYSILNQSLEDILFFRDIKFDSFRRENRLPLSKDFGYVSDMVSNCIEIRLPSHSYFSSLTIDYTEQYEVTFVFTSNGVINNKYLQLIMRIANYFGNDCIQVDDFEVFPKRYSFHNSQDEVIIDVPSSEEFIVRLIHTY